MLWFRRLHRRQSERISNSKLFVFGSDGSILSESRTKPCWIDDDGIRVLDDQALFDWMKTALAEAVDDFAVVSLRVTV